MSLSRLASQQVARTVGDAHAAADVALPDKDDRFDLLTKYIPTETLTLYIAAMAILPTFTSLGIEARTIYVAGVVLTPMMLLLVSLGKLRASGSQEAFRPRLWPFIAATLAFVVWAASVPGLVADENKQIVIGFAALVLSTLLGLLDAVLQGKKTHGT